MADTASNTSQSETLDKKKNSTTKTVTFSSKSEVLVFEHSLYSSDPYFDTSSALKVETKTGVQDGLGPSNQSLNG